MTKQRQLDLEKEDAAFERFSIMTIDGHLSDEEASKLLLQEYGFYITNKVLSRITKCL